MKDMHIFTIVVYKNQLQQVLQHNPTPSFTKGYV